ncbi:hypothetical protein O9G_001603 [Rozella allomycis CSF55]|uniref:Uncharacterized protein n=1 Tax=Rozella allomycis (strain CSF55) TaxID=988480 RepID=A0A075AX11_ROZAC|nr:hypothetical protein O9G_001603 [Rozella allomycis CSF55]|eukprot:EPZ33252.1 hypothetical protein O9G_001603 [Rozella allomycis CSF55]
MPRKQTDYYDIAEISSDTLLREFEKKYQECNENAEPTEHEKWEQWCEEHEHDPKEISTETVLQIKDFLHHEFEKFNKAKKIKSDIGKYLKYENPEMIIKGPWNTDTNTGNPALSKMLTVELQKIKRLVQNRKSVVSTKRAIDELEMKALFSHLTKLEDTKPNTACMFKCMYILMFMCMLDFDDVTRIMIEWFKIPGDDKNSLIMEFPLRQHVQNSDDKKNIHLCPITWVNIWLATIRKLKGPLFVNISENDEVIRESPITRDFFVTQFNHHLQAIGLDAVWFDTKSFSKGSVQFFYRKGFEIVEILHWSGQSKSFNENVIAEYIRGQKRISGEALMRQLGLGP